MENQSKTRKLADLRAKTERQLAALITSQLDRGLNPEAERLLPLLRNSCERSRLELRLSRVKELSACKSVYAA